MIVVPKILYAADPRLISTHAGGFDWRLGVFRDTFAAKPDGPATNVRRDNLDDGELLLRARAGGGVPRSGLLDERFFMYYEETDFIRRAQGDGYRRALRAVGGDHHRESGSSGGGWMTPFKQYYATRNRIYLIRKHAASRLSYAYFTAYFWATRVADGCCGWSRAAQWRLLRAMTLGSARLLSRAGWGGRSRCRTCEDRDRRDVGAAVAGRSGRVRDRAGAGDGRHRPRERRLRGVLRAATGSMRWRGAEELAHRARARGSRAAADWRGSSCGCRHVCARSRSTLLHSTHHTLPLAPMRCRRVVTVHDVDVLAHPAALSAGAPALHADDDVACPRASPTRSSSRRRRCATTCSAVLGACVAEKAHVIYEAAAPRFAATCDRARATEVARRYGVEPPYILSVGSLEPGKNRGRLIRALHELRSDGIGHKLVVVGQPAWKLRAVIRAGAGAGDGAAGALRRLCGGRGIAGALRRRADVFALPALYEGFGLPVLEAMAAGTPVLTSNTGATAEVAGDAALLVDPRSVAAIRDGLRALLTDAGAARRTARARPPAGCGVLMGAGGRRRRSRSMRARRAYAGRR